jgi:hypothetical protein
MFLAYSLGAALDTLAFTIKEYGTSTNRVNRYVTDLVVVAYNSANVSVNCTFAFITTAVANAPAYSYNSACIDQPATTTPSTATIAQFLKFNMLDMYYNKTLYLSINAAVATALGADITKFFAGTLPGATFTLSATPAFAEITKQWNPDVFNVVPVADPDSGFIFSKFSSVNFGLFIANFSGNYSYLSFTVTDLNNVVKCTMMYTLSLNEAICSLGM